MVNNKKVTSKYVARELARRDLMVFRPKDVAIIQDSDKRGAYHKLREMVKGGYADRVRNGLYVLKDMKGEMPDPFIVASKAVSPSYISYLSALNFHGLSDQVPRVVQMATTVRTRPFAYEGMRVKYHLVQPDKMYGYTPLKIDELSALIAFPEKALIDSFDNPSTVGGAKEIINIVEDNIYDIDIQRMKEFLKIYPSKSTVSRIGFLLEKSGVNIKSIGRSTTPVPLIPGEKSTEEYSKDWNVYYNKEMISRLQRAK